jgi:arylsulfatase A-like enzyme
MTPLTIKNVILVSYDSVRADVAYTRNLPGLEALRKNGVTFRKCVSSAPVTPISHATVMTGLQPYRHGIRHLFREKLDRSCETIATILADRGFDTSGVVSCPGLNAWYEIGRGYARWDDEIPLLPDGSDPLQTVDVKLRGSALKRANVVIERSAAQLAAVKKGQSYLHFIHFFDAHWPYEPPFRPFSIEVANAYEAEIAFLDHHFHEWFKRLLEEGKLDETLIVMFGDHGEDLDGWYPNDKGGEKLGHPEEMGHGCLLYDQTVMVPLVFWHKDLHPREVQTQVRLVDIMPTVLELLGQGIPANLDGQSVASLVLGTAEVPHRVGYSETHYPTEQTAATNGRYDWTRDKKAIRIADRYKIIFHIGSDQVEVYDLKEDPLEERNLLSPVNAAR